MSAYLQLGHESWSLLDEPALSDFKGIVLSPVNDTPEYVEDRLKRLKERRGDYEIILDPQFYNPASNKAKLTQWSFFPSDFETAVGESLDWWAPRAKAVVEEAVNLGFNAVCSPIRIPKIFTSEYYAHAMTVADLTCEFAEDTGVDVLATLIVRMKDLSNPQKAFEIASIMSRGASERVYIIFLDDVPQREPFDDSEALPTAVHLIRLLTGQGLRVHVAFCAHDLVLWKHAGAADISSGKWMNVRRFSPGRWEEEETGGRQVPYWNEGPLFTLLREQDVKRLDRDGWFKNRKFSANPFGAQILEIIRGGAGTAWQKLSWLQYLRWTSNAEARFSKPEAAERYLEHADSLWTDLQLKKILLIDRFNDGSWVRIWLNAIREGSSR
ncbi:hypothetical protein J2W37_004616 [Variovorax paradoxus]|uniref:hypothetical protein n=1 Tax=Variovorax paradoxus TaxID=34073 RepID=UPI0027821AC4|nr:hypothetical protein [Variovorax paradoxus]MDP9966886.1 hypothetical protein [Variovorax paradoxus]